MYKSSKHDEKGFGLSIGILKNKEHPSSHSFAPPHMEIKSQIVNTLFIILLASSHFSLVAPTNSWVGSKYQIQCTMCAACDNPCNQPSPSPPPPQQLYPPPPSPPAGAGAGGTYYYPPPPPTGGGQYYSPPSQGVYYYYPPPGRNYPTPGPPNPIMGYYPYYFYNPPLSNSAAVSLSGTGGVVFVILMGFLKFL